MQKRSTLSPLPFAAIADGAGLKWQCWPSGIGWRHGPHPGASAAIASESLTGRRHRELSLLSKRIHNKPWGLKLANEGKEPISAVVPAPTGKNFFKAHLPCATKAKLDFF